MAWIMLRISRLEQDLRPRNGIFEVKKKSIGWNMSTTTDNDPHAPIFIFFHVARNILKKAKLTQVLTDGGHWRATVPSDVVRRPSTATPTWYWGSTKPSRTHSACPAVQFQSFTREWRHIGAYLTFGQDFSVVEQFAASVLLMIAGDTPDDGNSRHS